MKKLHHLLMIICLLTLAACSSRQQPDNTNWRQQREKLESVTHWTISGKLAIITAEKKGSTRIRWQQNGDDYDLNLTSMLGTRVMEMQKPAIRYSLLMIRAGNTVGSMLKHWCIV